MSSPEFPFKIQIQSPRPQSRCPGGTAPPRPSRSRTPETTWRNNFTVLINCRSSRRFDQFPSFHRITRKYGRHTLEFLPKETMLSYFVLGLLLAGLSHQATVWPKPLRQVGVMVWAVCDKLYSGAVWGRK